MHSTKFILLLILTFALSACFNDNEEQRVVLGDVSLGDQLIDLKKAHEAGAISRTEYKKMRQGLIELVADEDYDDDDDDDEDEEIEAERDRDEDAEEEDGFSWL